jgi:hypothetical protein
MVNLLKRIFEIFPSGRYPGDQILQRKYSLLVSEIQTIIQGDFPLRAKWDLALMELIEPTRCSNCSKLVRWSNKCGWMKHCSGRCASQQAAKNPEVTKKKQQTCMDRYGVTHWTKTEEHKKRFKGKTRKIKIPKRTPEQIKITRAKYLLTCHNRYGADNGAKTLMARAKISSSLKTLTIEQKAKKLELFKLTTMANHGVEFPMQSEVIQAKSRATTFEHFGVEHPAQSPIVQARMSNSYQNSLGVAWPGQSQQVKQKIRLSNLVRFGFPVSSQSPIVKAKFKATCLAKYGLPQVEQGKISKELYDKLTSKEFWQQEYLVKEKPLLQITKELEINKASTAKYFYLYSGLEIRKGYKESFEQLQLTKYIQSFEYPVLTSVALRDIFSQSTSAKELDIYIPELKLAFEYNGVYWHSEEYHPRDSHLNKTLACEALGIRLIHIWSDDWLWNTLLMKRKIKALLGKEQEKVYARKCKIVIPTCEQKRHFYQENHIKGDGAGSISYALEYQSQPVAMITFKDMQDGIFDLNRYATSCSIPGGFSRLLEHFKRNSAWEKIYTYADRCWSQGNVYLKNDFKLTNISRSNYHGIEERQRVNRMHYTFERLSKRFPDAKGTQFQIMDQAGIPRIWDCGQLRFELNRLN